MPNNGASEPVPPRKRQEAAAEGTGVERSEVVGLAPERALPEDVRESILLDADPAEKSLERKIRAALST